MFIRPKSKSYAKSYIVAEINVIDMNEKQSFH